MSFSQGTLTAASRERFLAGASGESSEWEKTRIFCTYFSFSNSGIRALLVEHQLRSEFGLKLSINDKDFVKGFRTFCERLRSEFSLKLSINDKDFVKGQTYKEEKRAYESFTTDDMMVKAIMLAFREDDEMRVFEDCPTVKKMFDTITSKYNTMTAMHVQLLLEQYNSYKMKESDNVMDHVNKILVMAKDLAVVGNVISDNMQISTILNSRPPSWDVAVTALSVQFDNLTLEKLPIQLALQQQRLTKRNRA
ncbi:hypothetical protein EJ110_NYTH29755 [Nymphaea thermarum]|nr:hypothetical protein EJ110_NYTH29755 [Nymphaea thermarum]